MSSRRDGGQQPQWQQRSDGYWELVPGDGTLFYQGVDGQMYEVPRILDTAGGLKNKNRDQLLQYLMGHVFYNDQGEVVEVTRATVTSQLHKSSSADPNSAAGPHMDVQLTNPTLMSDSARTHLLHFRPNDPESSFFYDNSMTREQVERLQNTRFVAKYKKKDDKDKKDPPRGGFGATGSSSKKGGGSKDSSSQQSSRRGGSSSSSSQTYQSRGGHGYSYTEQFYAEEGLAQQFGALLLQVWRGIFSDVACEGLTGILSKCGDMILPVIGHPAVTVG